jgi:hypothetical protein
MNNSDDEPRKRKLFNLLKAGASEYTAHERRLHPAHEQSLPPSANQANRGSPLLGEHSSGGFYRKAHFLQSDKARDEPAKSDKLSTTHEQAGTNATTKALADELLDDEWYLEDSDVLLAIKTAIAQFPEAPQCCPFALLTTVQVRRCQ